LKSIGSHTNQNWTEDFLLIASHVGGNIVDDSWSNKVSLGEFGVNKVTAIKDNLGTFSRGGLDDPNDSIF